MFSGTGNPRITRSGGNDSSGNCTAVSKSIIYTEVGAICFEIERDLGSHSTTNLPRKRSCMRIVVGLIYLTNDVVSYTMSNPFAVHKCNSLEAGHQSDYDFSIQKANGTRELVVSCTEYLPQSFALYFPSGKWSLAVGA